MPRPLRLAALLAGLAAPALAALSLPALAEPETHDGRVVLGFPGAATAAAYMVLHNHGGPDDRLLGASTPAASSVTLHASEEGEGGVVRMAPLDGGLPLPAEAEVVLEPGGLHVMLTGLAAPLAAGDTVALTLDFESGPLTVELPVELAGQGAADAHEGHGDHDH